MQCLIAQRGREGGRRKAFLTAFCEEVVAVTDSTIKEQMRAPQSTVEELELFTVDHRYTYGNQTPLSALFRSAQLTLLHTPLLSNGDQG